jgi:hypothetical protein
MELLKQSNNNFLIKTRLLMRLQSATFTFETGKGELIIAVCNPVTKNWTVVPVSGNSEPFVIAEDRSHQFVNQTRAKEIIQQFLKK